jgi:hypothetical protein
VNAQAAFQCKTEDTPLKCWTDAVDAVNAQLPVEARQAAAEQQESLAAKPTGVDTGGLALASNTKNFLPLLSLAGLLGNAQKGQDENTYVFDLNFLIPGLAKDNNAQLQAAVDSKPQISDALAQRIPEATRDATVKKLAAGLGDLDDYALAFTYNWSDDRHGRGFNQYRNRFQALTEPFLRQMRTPSGNQSPDALRAFGEFIRTIQGDFDDPFTETFAAIGQKKGEATMRALMRATEAALAAEIDRLDRLRAGLAGAGLDHFGDLVDNQPQLHLSAQKRFRDPVVGADETSAQLTYEWSMASFNNAMTRDCHNRLNTPDPASIDDGILKTCLAQYKAFVNANLATLKTGNRFSLSAEYLDIPEETIDRPQVGVTGVTLAGAKKLIVSAGWSRLFPAGQGVQPIRLDLVAKYENVSNDPTRQDRGVATLTVTRQFGNLAVPFGIVYATHGEFLGQVDKQLSAHLGLKFNLFGTTPAPPLP